MAIQRLMASIRRGGTLLTTLNKFELTSGIHMTLPWAPKLKRFHLELVYRQLHILRMVIISLYTHETGTDARRCKRLGLFADRVWEPHSTLYRACGPICASGTIPGSGDHILGDI